MTLLEWLCNTHTIFETEGKSFLFERVFTPEISSQDETRPGMKSSLSMVKCLLLFTRFCRDEISSQDEKKKKRRVNTSSWDETLKWACFFNFWCMYSSMFSKFSMFEHNESMNIMKHEASLTKVKPEKKKDEHSK